MDGIRIKMEGVDDCMRMFDMFPDNMLKMEKVAMRKAAQAVAKNIRKATPKRFRRLVKYKMHEDRQRNSYVLIGLYNRKEIGGHQPEEGWKVPDWFKAYWANYGTLSRRDPSHDFKTKIKAKTPGNPRRQSVGQPPQRFFEKSLQGWQDIYLETLEKEMKKQENTLYDR